MAPELEFSPIMVIPQTFDAKYWVATTPQVATLLDVTQSTLRGWISRKLFPIPDGYVNGKAPYWYHTTLIKYVQDAPGGRLGYPVG